MNPRIIFLGTAGDVSIYGQQFRASGGIVIQIEGYQFFIDPGPGTLNQAKQAGINPRATTAVLCTHNHINHCNDINALIAAMTLNGFDRQSVLIASASVVNEYESNKPFLTKFHYNCLERVIVIKPKQKVGIEHIEIHALATKHHDSEAIGFKLFTPNFVLSYSGDTSYNVDLIEQYQNSDILILNTKGAYDERIDNNLNAKDAERIIKKVNPKLAILTHFGRKILQNNPLFEARRIHKETGIQVIAATDGTEINPLSYSAQLKHKTLNLFPKKEFTEEEYA